MIITIETSGMQEVEQLLLFLKSLNITQVKIEPPLPQPALTPGDKTLSPSALFGIWKKQPRTLEAIRASAWERKK
ncbi:MAG: hypothetical protein SF052_22070 [Bacteroidia bacterium]|nr:hypothetical protein [Bacteroidia bacterium]